MQFIDQVKIQVKAGNGGDGIVAFRREKYVPAGGPAGGNGGDGGSVILEATTDLQTLLDFRYENIFKGESGERGGPKNMTGAKGKDKIIKVPCGTVIFDAETNEVMGDLVKPGQQVCVAKGGKGGLGNRYFLSNSNRAPEYALPGLAGEERTLFLELKLIADIGIIGLPNAGKSTLISVLSSARPKIADYPFTTLTPNLGVVSKPSGDGVVLADIPGLIEGASEGKGLGIQFLRHVDRTKVLLFILDPYHGDVKADYKILINELKKYNPEMLSKKQLICISKADAMDDEMKKAAKKVSFKSGKLKPLIISSVSGDNIEELKIKLWQIITENQEI